MITQYENGIICCSHRYCSFNIDDYCNGRFLQCPNLSERAEACLPGTIRAYESIKIQLSKCSYAELDKLKHQLSNLENCIDLFQSLVKKRNNTSHTEESVNTFLNARASNKVSSKTDRGFTYRKNYYNIDRYVGEMVDLQQESNNTYSFHTKIVGVTFEGRQGYIKECYEGQSLDLVRDKLNPYDSNAIAVYAGNYQVGFISKELASKLAPQIDMGKEFSCKVSSVTGGGDFPYGLNVQISELSIEHLRSINSSKYLQDRKAIIQRADVDDDGYGPNDPDGDDGYYDREEEYYSYQEDEYY